MLRTILGGVIAATLIAGIAPGQTPTKDGAEFLVNTTTNASQQSPDIAVLAGGGFVVAFNDYSLTAPDTSSSAIRARLFDAAGSPVGADFLVNTVTSGDQSRAAVAALSDGGFVIVWNDQSGTAPDTSANAVRGQRYDAAGATVGSEFVANTFTAGSQYEPSITGLPGGGFVIAWTDESDVGADTSGTAIRARLYDAAGVAAGAEFLVNTATNLFQVGSSIAALSDGGFVITWYDGSGTAPDTSGDAVRAQRYDAAGAAVGGEFLVNTTTSGGQQHPSIAAFDGGGFVIAWSDLSATGSDTDSYAVRAQRYDAAGAAVGGEFLVNTTTASGQRSPSVSSLADGGFVISWQDDSMTGGDTDSSAIRAQRYDAASAATGDEFLVNTATTSAQNNVSTAEMSDGDLLIAWQDFSNTAPDTSISAVRAQRFSLAPLAPPEFLALDAGSDFTGQTLASEVGGVLDGDVIIDFGLADAFNTMGAGGMVEVEFTLTNATFDGPVPANAWTAATEANCDFGTPVFGGGAGGNVVRFESTGQLNVCTGSANDGFLTLPIEITSNGDPVSVNVTFTPTADAGAYTGSSDDLDLLAFAPAFDFSISQGAAGAGQFDANGDDLLGSGILGTLTLADFPADIESDIGVALADATDIAASAELVLTFPGGVAGIDETNVDLGGVACTQGAAPSDNVFTCALGGGDLDAIDNGAAGLDITIDDDANAATFVTAQTPSAVLTVTGNPDNTVSGASGGLADIELDDGLDVNAITSSNFDWVRFGSGGTESNFRIALPSAAEAQAVTQVQVTVIQGNGVSAGTVNLLPGDAGTGFQVKGATITFNSAALNAVSGESGNANITSVALEHDETALLAGTVPGLIILRQLVNRSPGSFVATPGLTSDN